MKNQVSCFLKKEINFFIIVDLNKGYASLRENEVYAEFRPSLKYAACFKNESDAQKFYAKHFMHLENPVISYGSKKRFDEKFKEHLETYNRNLQKLTIFG